MGNYDEFDLELKMSSGEEGGNDAASPYTGWACETSAISLESLLNSCTSEHCNITDSCPKTEYCTATGNTCTCHC